MNCKKILKEIASELNIFQDDEGKKVIVLWDYKEFIRAYDKISNIYNEDINYDDQDGEFYIEVEKETNDTVGFISWY